MIRLNHIIKLTASFGIALFLTGCLDQSYKMIGRECVQVKKYEPPYRVIKPYLHSITLYEGYETRAHFDVLIISDAMRGILAALYSERMGHSLEEKVAYLKQQRLIGVDTLEVYVLSQVNDSPSLSEKNSPWSLFITTAQGKRLKPFSSKEVATLSPEIRNLFGYRYIEFKTIHVLKFSAHDIQGNRFIRPGDVSTMTFAGTGMKHSLTWVEGEEYNSSTMGLIRQDNKGAWEMIKDLAKPKERDEDYYFC